MKTPIYLTVAIIAAIILFYQSSLASDIASSPLIPACKDNISDRADTTFIVDDGTTENGWFINPGQTGWLGNYFPVAQSLSGVIRTVDLFFLKNLDGENLKLTVDIFHGNTSLSGSSGQFTAMAGSWITVTLSDIPFSGPFFVMVKWSDLSTFTHFLGMDHNGPFASQDLERYYDGTTFQTLSDLEVSDPGAFLIRPTASVGSSAVSEPSIGQALVFPNPAAEFVHISTPGVIKSVSLHDISGAEVFRVPTAGQNTEVRLALDKVTDGFYILSVETAKGNYSSKISVIH